MTDPKDIEEHWSKAYPEPKKPSYSPKAVQKGMAIGGFILGAITFYFMYEFFQDRYGGIYWGSSENYYRQDDQLIPISYVFIASLPGALLGMIIGAFLGAKLGPRG